jgi:hypothetical protein
VATIAAQLQGEERVLLKGVRWNSFLASVLLFSCYSAAAQETHRSTKVFLPFDDQPTGRYQGERLERDWPGLRSDRMERASVVSQTDALNGQDGKCLRVLYPAGKVRSNESGASLKTRLPAREECYLEYRVRFGHGNGDHWDFGRGGKLPGLAGGACNVGGRKATGAGWSTRYMWREGGRMVAYVYHLDQKDRYGDQWELDRTFTPGKWYRLTQRVRVNSANRADGIFQVWVDGELVLDRHDVRFRTGTFAQVDHFLFSTFFGGSDASWAPEIDSLAYFDHFRIQPTPPAGLQID